METRKVSLQQVDVLLKNQSRKVNAERMGSSAAFGGNPKATLLYRGMTTSFFRNTNRA